MCIAFAIKEHKQKVLLDFKNIGNLNKFWNSMILSIVFYNRKVFIFNRLKTKVIVCKYFLCMFTLASVVTIPIINAHFKNNYPVYNFYKGLLKMEFVIIFARQQSWGEKKF